MKILILLAATLGMTALESYELENRSSFNDCLAATTSLGANLKAAKPAHFRKYNYPLTKEEKEDLSFIVNTLGNDSITSIISKKSALERSGDRIDHLHPLRFLMGIFTDDKMNASVRIIPTRTSLVWNNFMRGIEKGMSSSELKPEYIADFASKVGIKVELIKPTIDKKDWKKFVLILIDKVPRKGNPSKYDI